MNRLEQLKEAVAFFDLSRHPFYVDWRMGTLPRDKLAAYATAFDPFIARVADAWTAAGRPDYAAVEREHHGMWRRFAVTIDAQEPAESDRTRTLPLVAANLFRAAPEAIGALYAFEAQQPVTATAKLQGLREHYSVGERGEEYFRVHADDWEEAKYLEQLLTNMPEPEFQRARSACALLGAALWGGLDEVYY
jgi:pyrroloquinoline quinone (PQQ) biosynthesis protein C